jgi:hypothetical protein
MDHGCDLGSQLNHKVAHSKPLFRVTPPDALIPALDLTFQPIEIRAPGDKAEGAPMMDALQN